MICFRAETAFGELLTVDYKKKQNEMHMLIKQTLTVRIYTLATPRDNQALKKVLTILNDPKTQYPETNLTLRYEMASP